MMWRAEAGVSLATVDRVLNGRPGVRPVTAHKVEAAIAALDFRRDLSASLLARSRDLNVHFFIPDGSNEFMENLGAAIRRRFRAAKAEPELQIVLVGAPDDPATRALISEAWRRYLPNAVLAAAGPNDPEAEETVPLLAGRPLVEGRPAAYVCERFACRQPVTDPAALAAQLER